MMCCTLSMFSKKMKNSKDDERSRGMWRLFQIICDKRTKKSEKNWCKLKMATATLLKIHRNFLLLSAVTELMCVHTCVCVRETETQRQELGGTHCLSPCLCMSPSGDSRVSGSLLSGPDGPATCSQGPQTPSTH